MSYHTGIVIGMLQNLEKHMQEMLDMLQHANFVNLSTLANGRLLVTANVVAITVSYFTLFSM